jgi:hypothetical protein
MALAVVAVEADVDSWLCPTFVVVVVVVVLKPFIVSSNVVASKTAVDCDGADNFRGI